jgi:hypothetical protein
VVEPVRHRAFELLRSHCGVLEIDGFDVEMMGDVQEWLDGDVWEEPADVTRHRRWVVGLSIRLERERRAPGGREWA